jgi:hypothetical protein
MTVMARIIMTVVIRIVAIILFVGGVYLTYYQATRPNQLGWWGDEFPFVYFVLTAFVLFVGIVFGCLFRQIKAITSGRVVIWNEVKGVFSSPSFWAALCVSPFVLFGVYATVSTAPGDPASYLLAFQNGFFCESIFNQIASGSGRSSNSITSGSA